MEMLTGAVKTAQLNVRKPRRAKSRLSMKRPAKGQAASLQELFPGIRFMESFV